MPPCALNKDFSASGRFLRPRENNVLIANKTGGPKRRICVF